VNRGLVTAVIPTYQRPAMVCRAVMSALRQTYRLMEVIVVVDGGDDATELALARIADPRLYVIVLPQREGGSEARNSGVRAARGEWIAFLDDDDEWLPDKIARQVEMAEPLGGMPVISSRLLAQSPSAEHVAPRKLYRPGTPVSEALFCRSSFADGAHTMQTSTLFTRRELLMRHPFRIGLKRHQDWDWLLRVSREASVSFHMLPEALTLYRIEDGRPGTSRSLDWEFSFIWAMQMKEHFTPKAYSFFLATECISRAVKSRAGWRALRRIGVEFFFGGRPTIGSIGWIVAFLVVKGPVRRRLRERLRGNRSEPHRPIWES
jgi:hypothetical protein